jgi:CelD/BcsL family acetyltransferase involved in cellulose biosynthesis
MTEHTPDSNSVIAPHAERCGLQQTLHLQPELTRQQQPPDAEASTGGITLRVETSFAAVEDLRDDWDTAVASLGGTIYMTYDWCRMWWEYYGGDNKLRILIFSSEGSVIGLIPLYVSVLGFRPLQLRVARLVGANIPPKVFNPALAKEHAQEVFDSAVTHMLKVEFCHLVNLGPISELYGKHLLEAARKHDSAGVGIAVRARGVHSMFVVPETYEQYLDGLTKKERKNNRNRYDLSLLKKECEGGEEFVSDPANIMNEYQILYELHTQQWQQKQGTGHFLSWPQGRDFNAAVILQQAALGRAEFLKIVVQGKPIASIYGFYIGNFYHAELMGRAYVPEWEKYNLGRAILVRALDRAISKGCKVMDVGLGRYEYKERLSAQEHAVFEIRCRRTQGSARVLYFIFECIRVVLLVIYHKVWYRRLRKLIPLRWRGPQASLWLRFDY